MSYPKAEKTIIFETLNGLAGSLAALRHSAANVPKHRGVQCEWQSVRHNDYYITHATWSHCSLPTRPTTQKRVFWIPRVFFYKIKLFKTRAAAKDSCFSFLNSSASRLST